MSNSKEYLINHYQNQLINEKDSFMKKVLEEAVRRLQAGNNPYVVEDWVVRIEKEHRSFNLPNPTIPTMYRLVFAIVLFLLAIHHMIYYQNIMHEPYMRFLIILIGGTGALLIANTIERFKKGI